MSAQPGELIAGVILAGGLARRMGGGDKALCTVDGEPMLGRIIARVRPQVCALALNANGNAARFAPWRLPVLADVVPGNAGPLAGVLTGLRWLEETGTGARWLASFPGDAPFLPTDLVQRLFDAAVAAGALLACARSNGRTHPVCALWHASVAEDLTRALTEEHVFKIDRFTARHALVHVDFATDPFDPFLNVNTPADLADAGRLAAALRG
ncbi:MAG: molybdenum cofactor guanylyltransferase MobA [Proteobacteria bacterium]|nr:molybdenum cofactor guanylyltransferase MobA [Pseudomonadota bacterium]